MKNIAILTEEFTRWGGGKDFIENIIFAIKSVAVENDLNLYVFVPTKTNYKQYNGLKRAFFKGKEKFSTKHQATLSNENFKDLDGVKFVEYPEISLTKALKKFKIDFIFPISTRARFSINIPHLIFLADCQHKYFPLFFGEAQRDWHDRIFNEAVNSNKKIIVNSKSAKEDLISFYNALPDKIFVLPFAPTLKPFFLDDYSDSIIKYNLPERYFLISNQFWLHKDYETAFSAFATLLKTDTYEDVQLICTGKMYEPRHPQHINDLKQLIIDLGMQDKIRCLGYIPKIEQIEIMKAAQAVVQPTIFEGGPGGGSIWDAVSLGITSIVSDIKTNLEIQEDNVIFFKAQDSSDLCEKMRNILGEPRIIKEKELLLKKSDENMNKLGTVLINIIREELR